ncbi:hypothetical protein NCLIV_038100 [Neospora caninum Liverpool]|uniref:Microneme protein MIC17B n=2 Tax=Neospora caninum TaxID=29176 RepID=F0VJW7_NEOCL|nr:hypothetical protein NCLIV_038100 [Neospora caninum Liverpool]AKP20156.1 microneme protein 17 C [Neospora caninum]CBZ54029.1 hypothetical protein NCLIV_038100 [Neospora caninum Liverpool]CEL68033.1 TPA: microneme protein MIC17B [Neospora caninum Liverpool]|eukprot:XP_003884060.1 hypothetical protein NCLIV_038100 [Neospora caninum Liverpool]
MEALKTVLSRRIALPVVVAAVLLQDVAEAGQYAGLRSQLVNLHSFAETEATSSGCLEAGKEYVGFALAEFSNVSDADTCQKRCSQHSDCVFFTFVSSGNRCLLHSTKPTEVKNNSNATAGPKRCHVCVLDGFDFKGQPNLVEKGQPGIKTLSACQKACAKESRCYGYLFAPQGKECHFKTTQHCVGALAPDANYMAGPKTCTDEHWCIMKDVDYPKNDLRKVKADTAAACQDACLNDEKCEYFSFEGPKKDCWLKAGAKVPSSKTKKASLFSGPKHCGLPTTCIKERTKYVDDTIVIYPKTEVGSFAACQLKCWKNNKCVFMHFNSSGCTLSGSSATEVADANSKAGDVTC